MRDRTVGDTFYMFFTTRAFATGIPTVLAGTPVVSAYEDGSITQITAGITLGVDHDSVVGLNLLTLVATGANGYEAGKDYSMVITTGTVDGVSVVGEVVGEFSLSLSAAEKSIAAGVDISAQAVDDVWDEVLTGATHNVNNSSGKRIRQISGEIFADGTAQSGGNNSIQLAAGEITTNNQFQRAKVLIVGGTGTGQEGIITSSVASTDTLTVTPTWLTNPDATSEYSVVPGQVHTTVRNGGYDNGMIYIDTVNGTAGTEKGVHGTSTNPSSNLVDTYTIAGNENLNTIAVTPGSALVLPSDSTGFVFQGTSYTIALNGQEIGDCKFIGSLVVTGTAINTSGGISPVFERCGMTAVTLPPSVGVECGFFGAFTLGSAGAFTFANSAQATTATVVFDYGAGLNASDLNLSNWNGGSVEIQNAGAGTGSYTFKMSGEGDLTVNANCSATTEVKLSGTISRNADVAGITYTEAANVVGILGSPAGASMSADIATLPTFSEIMTTQLTESYAANGTAPTLTQAMFAVHQMLMDFSISGTSYTVKQLDSSTTAFIVTLNDASDPSAASR